MNFVREKVSKKKKRFKEDGFDLDLTYITPRIIAMGFPSSDVEGLYRNPIGEVYKFYESRHRDRYKLYNLCAEREYDPERFHGRVSRYPFEDHNAPPIQLIVDCCKDIHNWLSEDENNVVGINCKAGKGRTGLIICCYLMHSGVVKNSEDAMLYYGTRRTKDGKGVTIASQRRYVRYYESVLNQYNGEAPPPRLLKLSKIKVYTVPNFSGKPFVSLEIKGREVCVSKAVEVSKKVESFEIEVDYPVFDDVKVQLCARKSKKKHQKMCHFWFSTAFVNEETNSLILEKFEIDVANKDKKNAHFKENFKIEAFFEPVEEPSKTPKKTKRKSDKKSKEDDIKVSSEKVDEYIETKPKSKKSDKESNEDFKTKRKRAQSFYDIEEDEDLSDSEKDEREMEKYFEEEDDECDESIKLTKSSTIVVTSENDKEGESKGSSENSTNNEDSKNEEKEKEEVKVQEESEKEEEEEKEVNNEEMKDEKNAELEQEPQVSEEDEPTGSIKDSKSKNGKKDKKAKTKEKKKDKEAKQKKKADKKISKRNLK